MRDDYEQETMDFYGITEEDLVYLHRSPLATPNKIRPVFIRKDATTIKIYPYSGSRVGDQSKTASLYFDLVVAINGLSNSSASVTLPNDNNASGFNNLQYVEPGQAVTPITAAWSYTEINGTALYNASSSVNFELHQSEETNLVMKILTLAGIAIKDQGLYQMVAQEDVKKTQQEKQ